MSKRNIVHVEVPAANVQAAGKFYQELFNWKLQQVPEMNYTMDDSLALSGVPAWSVQSWFWCRVVQS